MKIEFDIESLLLQAKNDNGEIIKKWTFTDFEEVLGYEITPVSYTHLTLPTNREV